MDVIEIIAESMTNNQYLNVNIKNGKLEGFQVFNRILGFLTLKISTLFTRPYVSIYGCPSPENLKLKEKIILVCKRIGIAVYDFVSF